MRYTIFAIFTIALTSSVAVAQQPATLQREGDPFRGPVKTVRSETAGFSREGDQLIETPRILTQVINYTQDGSSREIIVYRNGAPTQKTVETYYPSGRRLTVRVLDPEGNQISARAWEYDTSGMEMSETQFNGDGSVKDRKFIQSIQEGVSIIGHSTIAANGMRVETAVNTRDASRKTSTWVTTKTDGSRSEQIASRDEAGNHITEILTYRPDGSLDGRAISKVNAEVTRLESTEYDGQRKVLRKNFHTREYDSKRNLIKVVQYRWNAELVKFEPASATYNHITYYQ